MESVYIPVKGGSLHCRIGGTGKPLLLLHGNGEDYTIFQRQIDYFKAFYTVIALDTRGHGKSIKKQDTLIFEAFVNDIETVLDYLHIEKTTIIGFSDGGNTALLFAQYFPEKVSKLVIVGANTEPEGMKKVELLKVEATLAALKGIEIFNPKFWWKRAVYELMTTQLRSASFELTKILSPTLVMAGENDVIKFSHTQWIAQQIKNSQLVIIPKADHFFLVKNPNEFNKIAESFLKNH